MLQIVTIEAPFYKAIDDFKTNALMEQEFELISEHLSSQSLLSGEPIFD